MLNWRENTCRLSGKVVEDLKEAKAAAAQFNVPCVDSWFPATRLKKLRVGYHS